MVSSEVARVQRAEQVRLPVGLTFPALLWKFWRVRCLWQRASLYRPACIRLEHWLFDGS